MILSVRSNKATFKKVTFSEGFNVVLADRTKESTKKDSRNGLGKSSLIDIIHFCLGSSASKGKGLIVDPLKDWIFTVDLLLNEQKVSVSRSIADPKAVVIDGDFSSWPIKPKFEKKTGAYSLGLTDWNRLLGQLMFGIDDFKDKKYKPSYRSLISYFIRKGAGAFLNPFENFPRQREWDKQISNAYLLGLSWDEAGALQVMKEQEKALGELKKASGTGILKSVIGTVGELEATKIRLEGVLRKQDEELRSFKVHPQYKQLEEEANEITRQLHLLVNENIMNQRLLNTYESSIANESTPKDDMVEKLYNEAQITLPDMVKKQLSDAAAFHHQVIRNRRDFLNEEISSLKKKIAENEQKIHDMADDRAKKMNVLNTHGALEEYTKLQERYTGSFAQLQTIERKIDDLKAVEKGKSSLRIEKELLTQKARSDYDERKKQREEAIAQFNANSEYLYEAPGKLLVDYTNTGYKFGVDIERANSHGISHMKVFCYDLMLAQIWGRKTPSPRMLIHDSTIFDGVDERQVALALELACHEAQTKNFQYICLFNSDDIPLNEFSHEFELEPYVRLRLTDQTEDGGLLGIRF